MSISINLTCLLRINRATIDASADYPATNGPSTAYEHVEQKDTISYASLVAWMHIMATASRSHVVAISSIECEPREINPLAKTKHAGAARRDAPRSSPRPGRNRGRGGMSRTGYNMNIIIYGVSGHQRKMLPASQATLPPPPDDRPALADRITTEKPYLSSSSLLPPVSFRLHYLRTPYVMPVKQLALTLSKLMRLVSLR